MTKSTHFGWWRWRSEPRGVPAWRWPDSL